MVTHLEGVGNCHLNKVHCFLALKSAINVPLYRAICFTFQNISKHMQKRRRKRKKENAGQLQKMCLFSVQFHVTLDVDLLANRPILYFKTFQRTYKKRNKNEKKKRRKKEKRPQESLRRRVPDAQFLHQNKEGGRWEMLRYLCEESPPLPVSQLEVGSTVPLNHTDSVDLLQALLVVPANKQN